MKLTDYELSAHAETVMAERGIREEWLKQALLEPQVTVADKKDPEVMHALVRIPEHGDRVLRVIYNPSTSPVRVVTAFFDRTQRNKL